MIPADRKYLEEIEEMGLAPWAARSSSTRGRVHPENPHPYRTEFQRDRERIIHSRAFRRLEYKTQVFINHEGDHYRTRLTHTMEVAQISRTIARTLRLNEDLAESIALAHDLGHTPFGHAGEKELNRLLKDHGGFEHNRQSLRVVDEIEAAYPGFTGLNLTWETREGIIKHSSQYDRADFKDFLPEEQPTLEAQIIDIADEIAYNNHDLDDGLSSGLIKMDDIKRLAIYSMVEDRIGGNGPEGRTGARTMIRAIINLLVSDLIKCTVGSLERKSVKNLDDIRKAGEKLTGFSDPVRTANGELKKFLKERLYQHYRVARMSMKAQKVMIDLFRIYTVHPDTLPDDYQTRIESEGVFKTTADFIAGMTDRYALEEHRKLTDPMIRV